MTSTMSFAAATCSIVCVGMLPIRSYFSLVRARSRCKVIAAKNSSPRTSMTILFRFCLFFLLLFAIVAPARGAAARIEKGDVVVVPLEGEVSPSMFLFLRRVLKAAESDGAGAIIFEMNTYGGR